MLCLFDSTRRIYASCTSAVAWSVWPGFSWAILRRPACEAHRRQGQQLLGRLAVAFFDRDRIWVTSLIASPTKKVPAHIGGL